MNKTVVFFLFLFIVFIKFVFSENDQFYITVLSDTSKTIPQAPNDIILPTTSTTLQQVTTVPESLQNGQVLLRRRFRANEYGLYLGIMNHKGYKRLSAFRPPEKLDVSTFVNRKLYESRSENPDQDIENVYFDGKFIYVVNVATVYFHDSIWNEMKMLDVLPSRLNITSEPSGASIYLNNEYKGTTPCFLGAFFEQTAVVRLEMKGYFIAEHFVDLVSGSLVEKHITLMKKPVFDDGTEIDIEAYAAENTESVLEIQQRIETLKKSVKQIEKDSLKAVRSFRDNYPEITPKDQFETTEEFENRQKKYTAKFDSELTELKQQFNEKRLRVLNIIPQVETYLDNIKEREYKKYFDGDSLKLSHYNADKGFFPVSLNINETGFKFSFNGKLYIPRDEAKEFYSKGTKSGKIILTYKNWLISIPKDTVKQNFYVYFTAFQLKFKDINYELRGECAYPDFIENSKEYANFKKTLDEKLEKERIAEAARGVLSITTKPYRVPFQLSLDNTDIGVSPITLSVRPGAHDLRLEAKDFKPVSDKIIVVKDSIINKTYEMEYTQAYLDSMSLIKRTRSKKIQWIRRITFGSLAVISGGAGIYYQNKTKNTLNEYNNLGAKTSQEKFDITWNLYEKYSHRRNLCYMLSGLCAVGFAVSIPF